MESNRIEENGLKGWKLGWGWKGDATEAEDEGTQKRLLIAAKRNDHWVLLRNVQYLNSLDSLTVSHIDNTPAHTRTQTCLPIHTQN